MCIVFCYGDHLGKNEQTFFRKIYFWKPSGLGYGDVYYFLPAQLSELDIFVIYKYIIQCGYALEVEYYCEKT